MSAVELIPSGDLSDVVVEFDMLATEATLLQALRPHLDADCWPVDERITVTLELMVAHATAALDSIRERDGKQLASWTQLSLVDPSEAR